MLGKAWQYFKLLLGGLLALISVFGSVAPEDEHLQRYAELEAAGTIAPATVIDKRASDNIPAAQMGRFGPAGGFAGGAIAGYKLSKALDGESGVIDNALASYAIQYEFRTPDGTLIADTAPVPATVYAAISVGSKVEVIYHPQRPTVHRLTEHSRPYAPIDPQTKLISAFMFGGLGLLLMWRNWPSRGAGSGSGGTGRAPLSTRAALSAPQASAHPAMAGRPRRTGFGQR